MRSLDRSLSEWDYARLVSTDRDTCAQEDLQPEDCSNWQIGKDRIWYVQRPERGAPNLASHSFSAGGEGQKLMPLPMLSYKTGLGLTPDGKILMAQVVSNEADLMLLSH